VGIYIYIYIYTLLNYNIHISFLDSAALSVSPSSGVSTFGVYIRHSEHLLVFGKPIIERETREGGSIEKFEILKGGIFILSDYFLKTFFCLNIYFSLGWGGFFFLSSFFSCGI